ncbi:DUF4249 domain-containing protein [Dyadobacter tibetensis]|uniref:DUF4249 domain-containing protein n=1 Tax=Dyadobacter tibetensis TaxID=1211851 RepID=UPI0018DC9E1A|nr:DUF4249 domain-containing protein [Dyadobacter tibetensis]
MIIGLLMACSHWSCESLVTDLDPNSIPGTRPKLVVESYISPQLPAVQVSVSESKTIYGPVDNNFISIKNAKVVLSDGSREIVLPYHTDLDRYQVDSATFRIVPGKTYLLTVSANNKLVRASTVIPPAHVKLNRYLIDTLLNRNFRGDSTLRIRGFFNDPAGQTNFFSHRAYIEYEVTEMVYDPVTGSYHQKRVRRRRIMDSDDNFGPSQLQNDINLDGKELKAPTWYFTFPWQTLENINAPSIPDREYSPNPVIVKIHMETLNVDEAYYRFHRSWLEGSGNNPFSEPTVIFSNIQDGLGCFGSYQNGVTIIRF